VVVAQQGDAWECGGFCPLWEACIRKGWTCGRSGLSRGSELFLLGLCEVGRGLLKAILEIPRFRGDRIQFSRSIPGAGNGMCRGRVNHKNSKRNEVSEEKGGGGGNGCAVDRLGEGQKKTCEIKGGLGKNTRRGGGTADGEANVKVD